VLLLSIAGCSAIQKVDAAENRIEEKLDAAENRIEDKLEAAGKTWEEPSKKTLTPTGVPAAEAELLTEEQARKIALDYLGLDNSQITRMRSDFEVDDGIPQYEVEFFQDDWEHEFEIHGETGRILSYDKDHKHD
jgi:uncharacterized membrane protein YkoI